MAKTRAKNAYSIKNDKFKICRFGLKLKTKTNYHKETLIKSFAFKYRLSCISNNSFFLYLVARPRVKKAQSIQTDGVLLFKTSLKCTQQKWKAKYQAFF